MLKMLFGIAIGIGSQETEQHTEYQSLQKEQCEAKDLHRNQRGVPSS